MFFLNLINYGFTDGTTYIGWYPYRDFCGKNNEESLRFALEIFEEIEKLRKEE